jgi:hypothetical protein
VHIGEKDIENLFMNMLLKEKELLTTHEIEKRSFHAFLLGNRLKNSNLKLSK